MSPESVRLVRENEALRSRVEELKQTIREMSGASIVYPPAWRLTPFTRTLMGLLTSRSLVTRAMVQAAMGEDWTADIKVVDVQLCRMRRTLARYGIRVLTVWGQGWALDPEQRAAIKAACATGNPSIGPPVPPDERLAPLVRDQLLAAMEPGEFYKVSALQETLGASLHAVRTALVRLTNDGDLRVVRRAKREGHLYVRTEPKRAASKSSSTRVVPTPCPGSTGGAPEIDRSGDRTRAGDSRPRLGMGGEGRVG